MEYLNQYWPFLLVVSWFIYKWWNSKKVAKLLPDLLKKGGMIIDVRTAGEYAQAKAPNTKNIPLDELNSRAADLPKNIPLILCCASGSRSGMAKMILKKKGFKEVYNIGSWTKVH